MSETAETRVVAVLDDKIVGFLRSTPCIGDIYSRFPYSEEEHTIFSNK